jgi:branched-subunit amino acid ABC-type transport system permease component
MIAGAMLFWIAMQWFGPQIGLTMRVFVLIDLAVLAAFLWALVVAFQLWRTRQAEDE